MEQQPEPNADGSHLEKRLIALEAIYRRYGARGLQEQPLAEVGMLLASKELRLRDSAKHNITEAQQASNRQLELEIIDIKAYVKSQTVGLSLADLRAYGHQREQQQGHYRQKGRDHGR